MKRLPYREWPQSAKVLQIVGLILVTIGGVIFFAMKNQGGFAFFIPGAIASIGFNAIIRKEENARKAVEAEKQRKAQLLAPYIEDEKYNTMLAHCEGLDKYYKMAAHEEEKNREAAETLRKMGGILQQSVYQEKEKDWAVRGGIASGIGGLGAGVAAAVDAMQDNERIRKENADRRAWGNQQRDLHEQMAQQVEAKRQSALSMYQLKQKFDVNLSWAPQTLLKYIYSESYRHAYHVDEGTGVVRVSVTVGNYAPMMIDGSLRGKLYTKEGKCAGCAYLPLPVGGTSQKDIHNLGGFCVEPKYPGPYKVKVEAADLWELIPKGEKSEEKSDGLSDEKHRKLVAEAEQRYLAELN